MLVAVSLQVWPYSVRGRLVSSGTPLSEIEVTISDNSGEKLGNASTDNAGRFLIENIGVEKIMVEADGKGYAPLRIDVVTNNEDTDLGTMNLERNTDLEEVTVVAKSKVDSPGKTIVYVSQVEKERASTPFNMLTILAYKAPEIHVRESERTLTIDGEEPQILVNGIKRSMSFISSIKPDAIERIEFSTTPDIRFGKRSLNIITRRPQEGGWVMADLTGAITTPRYFLGGVAEYTKGRNDFMFYYDGGYRHGTKEYEDEEERYIGKEEDITLSVEGLPSSTLDRYHNLYLYFTHAFSDNSMFAATASLNIHDNDKKTSGSVTGLHDTYDRVNDRGFRQTRPNLSLYYYLKATEKTSVEIDAIGSYGELDSHRNLGYSTGYDSRLSTKSDTWFFSTEALWRQILPFAHLNTGIGISYNNASNKYIIDGSTSRQTLESTRLNAYTSMGGSVFTAGYNISAGFTYYKVERAMVSPDFLVSLQKSIGDNINLSYNFRYNQDMPSVGNYNDVVTPVNDLMYRVGTGNLKAQKNVSNSLQISFNKNKFHASLRGSSYHISDPFVIDYTYQDAAEEPLYGYFLQRPGNGRRFINYSADCNIGVSNLWNFLSLSASAGWGHNTLESAETFTVRSWDLGLNLGLYWKGWQLNMTADNLVPSWSMYGGNTKIRRSPYTSLAIYKKLGNWYLHAAWSNLFSRYGGRYRTKTLTSVVPASLEYRMNDQGNLVEIGVRYQFTTGRLLNKRNRSISLSGGGDNGIEWDY